MRPNLASMSVGGPKRKRSLPSRGTRTRFPSLRTEICPTRSFYYDPDTYEVNLKTQTCIACGSCITACPTKAIKLTL